MKGMMKRLARNNKGAFSILWVILIFIGVLIATTFIDILVQSYSLQEVQSIMDTSGVSALRTGVDETKLRIGTFDVDRSIVEDNYKNLVRSRMSHSQNIKSFQFQRTNVEYFAENWGLGITGKSRPQALIDSTMIVTVNASSVVDTIPGGSKMFYDSRSGGSFTVSYLGRTQDGKIELAIRSVSRIVYR